MTTAIECDQEVFEASPVVGYWRDDLWHAGPREVRLVDGRLIAGGGGAFFRAQPSEVFQPDPQTVGDPLPAAAALEEKGRWPWAERRGAAREA